MYDNSFLQGLLAWILTYALHSTVLLAAVWMLTRWLSSERLRWKERLWKTALFGGMVSASLQAAVNIAPLGGRLEWTHPVPFYLGGVQGAELLPAAVLGPVAAIELSWDRLLLGVWMLGGLLGVGLFFFAWRRITDRLAGRKPVGESHAKRSLRLLARQAGLSRAPRLTVSAQLKSPATIGVFFPQICVPERALVELSDGQQEALLAHELAHILRRDPAWFFLCGLVERIFFFQPLNRIARRDLQELAEFQCDDWATRNTRDSLGLARCLTEVATWVLDERPVVAVVHMASSNSRLSVRIGRLLDEQCQRQAPAPSRFAGVFPVATLSLAALCLPGASALGEAGSPPRMQSPWSTGLQSAPPGLLVPVPTMLPAAPSTQEPDLDLESLLALLDQELEALYVECDALKRNFAGRTNPPQLLADLDQRLSRLRQRQSRLRAILPALRGQVSHPYPRNPKQEESK